MLIGGKKHRNVLFSFSYKETFPYEKGMHSS